MENKQELMERIQSFITKLSAKKTKLELAGVTVEWSGELDKGTKVEFLEGEKTDTLELEDGRTLMLNDESEVLSILEEEVEMEAETAETETELQEDEDEEVVEEQPDEEAEPEMSMEDRMNQVEGWIGALTQELAEIREVISSLETGMNEEKEKVEQFSTQLTELAKAPAVPSKKETVTNSFNKTESRAARVMAS